MKRCKRMRFFRRLPDTRDSAAHSADFLAARQFFPRNI